MGAIVVYVWGYYSHAPRSKFGRVVSTLNVTFAAVTLVERLFIFFWNDACAFFFFETAYFACEYNLFHYRTAIFYQQNVTVYKWLVRICQFINLAMFYHNLVFAILGGRFYFIYMTCIGDVLLNTQATAVPVAVVSVSTILLAFYTIGKYWRQSGDTARRSMRILWLVLLNSVYNFASAMLNGTPVNASYGQQLTSYWLTVLNKVISLILAVMVHRRVRERETNKAFSKQQQAPASSVTPNRKTNSAAASVSHGPAKTSTPLVGGATSGQ